MHAAAAYAKTKNRLQTWAVTSSIGPGATNMVTGAALATTNRLPVLLLPVRHLRHPLPRPGAAAARRPALAGHLRQRRVQAGLPLLGPDQPARAAHRRPCCAAMRVLTDPAETGAATVCLPQDVQAEAYDFPVDFFTKRVWHVARPVPEPAALARAVAAIKAVEASAGGRRRRRHLLRRRPRRCGRSPQATGIPVSDTQAGKGAINFDHRMAVGGVGSTGGSAANTLAREADLVIGIGTRYSDFTTASHTDLRQPRREVRQHQRDGLRRRQALRDHGRRGREGGAGGPRRRARRAGAPTQAYQDRAGELDADWQQVVDTCYAPHDQPLPGADRGVRCPERADGRLRRRDQRGRLDARRPAGPVACTDARAVPPRVRLLLHGLRDPGGHGREARGRRRPRGGRDRR